VVNGLAKQRRSKFGVKPTLRENPVAPTGCDIERLLTAGGTGEVANCVEKIEPWFR
jgi:hypothetical protein